MRRRPDIESKCGHGVPGVVKNALDWVVGSGELVDKPIALISASKRATHAWASLAEHWQSCRRVIREASITVPLDGRALDENGIVGDAELSTALRSAIDALGVAARDARAL
jgi:NAD(P)H-dependent FMN reductase